MSQRNHLELAVRLVRFGVAEQEQTISLQPPAAARGLRAVVGAGARLEQGSVAA